MSKAALSGLAALTLFDIVGAQAQTMPPPAWPGGFYFGAHVGHRSSQVDTVFPFGGFPGITFTTFDAFSFINLPLTFPVGAAPLSIEQNGPTGGIHAGFNWIMGSLWLVGLEGSLDRGKATSSGSFFRSDPVLGTAPFSYQVNLDWSAALRIRAGLFWDQWLFYGTGGLALQRITFSARGGFAAGGCATSFDSFCLDSFSLVSSTAFSGARTLFGYTVGLGIERFLGGGWSLRGEYLFADFGKTSLGNATIIGNYSDTIGNLQSFLASRDVSVNVTTQTVQVGISKQFP